MSGLSQARVVIAGAGAFGSTIALRLVQAGASVTLVDPDLGAARSASAVAAGMLAPAFESVLDPETNLSFELMCAARDLWAGVEAGLNRNIGLTRAGAAWIDLPGAAPRAEAIQAHLAARGARLAPSPVELPTERDAVYTPEDWRLSPVQALPALQGAFRAAGGRVMRGALAGFEPGFAILADGGRLAADRIVLATGASPLTPTLALAPELSHLIPIKGQIVAYPDFALPAGAPTLRCEGGYVTGGEDGLRVGATMETGRRDLMADTEVINRLHALAGRLYPAVQDHEPIPAAGVRAASPDGRPMVGPSQAPGVILAVGARRNGWLLAPLVAQITLAYLAEQDPGRDASVFEAHRFEQNQRIK